jgi:hypothetical protein
MVPLKFAGDEKRLRPTKHTWQQQRRTFGIQSRQVMTSGGSVCNRSAHQGHLQSAAVACAVLDIKQVHSSCMTDKGESQGAAGKSGPP